MRNVPALIIGLLMLAYWLSVLAMVLRTKRQTGRSANLLPPEPVGKLLRIIWYPVVVIWIAQPLYVAYTRRRPMVMRPLADAKILAWIAVPIAILAFIATCICWKRMGKSWRMGIDPREKTQLIVQGPYAYMRHPIYSLSILLMLCTVAIVPSPLMLVTGAVHIGFLIWESWREEQYLKATHGEPYVRYCERVSRFMPRRPAAH